LDPREALSKVVHRDLAPAPASTTQIFSETFTLAPQTRVRAWLVYQSWASWLYALPCYEVQFVHVFIPEAAHSPNAGLLHEFGSAASFHQVSSLSSHLVTDHPDVLLVQGDFTWWWSLEGFRVLQSPVLLRLDLPCSLSSTLPFGWSSVPITPGDCGGILDGVWLVLHNLPTPLDLSSVSPVRCSIHHILDSSLMSGARRSPSKTVTLPPLTPDQRLPVSALGSFIQCPTVYPSRPNVLRSLSFAELAPALDLPAGFIPDTYSHVCCRAAPAKILYHFFRCWRNSVKGGGGCCNSHNSG